MVGFKRNFFQTEFRLDNDPFGFKRRILKGGPAGKGLFKIDDSVEYHTTYFNEYGIRKSTSTNFGGILRKPEQLNQVYREPLRNYQWMSNIEKNIVLELYNHSHEKLEWPTNKSFDFDDGDVEERVYAKEVIRVKNKLNAFIDTDRPKNWMHKLVNKIKQLLRGARRFDNIIDFLLAYDYDDDVDEEFAPLNPGSREFKMKENSEYAKKIALRYFNQLDLDIMINHLLRKKSDSIGNIDVFKIPTKIEIKHVPYVAEINSRMRENENASCVVYMYKQEFANDKTVLHHINQFEAKHEELAEEGYLYDDVRKLQQYIVSHSGYSIRLQINDLCGNKIKTISTEPKSNKKQVHMTAFQFNNHIDTVIPKVFKYKELIKLIDSIKPKYVAEKSINKKFRESNEPCNVVIDKNGKFLRYITETEHLLIKDPQIDRKKYPTHVNYTSCLFTELKGIINSMDKTHFLRDVYRNQPRKILVGKCNENPYEDDGIQKIDMISSYPNFGMCEYAKDFEGKNFIPEVPMEVIYECDNSIFESNISGMVWVKNIIPTILFRYGSVEHIKKTFDLRNGWMTMEEARYWHDTCYIDVLYIIPSRRISDKVTSFLKKIDDKLDRNTIIGKMLTRGDNNYSYVSSDPEMTKYLTSQFTLKDMDVKTYDYEFDDDDKYKCIITVSSNNTSHGTFCYLYHFIIAMNRIRMIDTIAELLERDCLILNCTVDSIEFINNDDSLLNLDFLDKTQWKVENYKPRKHPFTEYMQGYDHEQYEVPEECPEYKTYLEHQLISFEAEAGAGKTYEIQQLFPKGKALLLASTGSAAVNLSPDAITIQRYLTYPIKYHNYRAIVIDEVSMLSTGYLHRLAKSCEGPTLFSGKHVIIMGDPVQLQPVDGQDECTSDKNTYGLPRSCNRFVKSNIYTHPDYKHFHIPDIFKNNFRVVDPKLREFLYELRTSLLKNKGFFKKNKEAIAETKAIRKKITKECDYPIIELSPDNTYICLKNETKDVINESIIKKFNIKEPKIIIRQNDGRRGLYNGQYGIMRGDSLVCVVDGKEVSIHKDNIAWQYGYAITVYISQGRSIKGEIVIFNKELDDMQFYVAVSRASELNQLSIHTSLGVAPPKPRADICQ